MIADILKTLRANEYYGAGNCTEIAKGKHEYIITWIGFKRKIKRIWRSRRL